MFFSPFPRSWRFALLGLATVCTTALSVLGSPIALTAMGFLGMYFTLAFRKELILDTTKRTYVWRDGIWPLMGSRRGSFDDLRWVAIDAYEIPSEYGPKPSPEAEFLILLAWKPIVGSRPYLAKKSLDFAEAARLADALAKAADIPVVENVTLKELRPKLGAAAYDTRILIPVDDRPMSLAARLRR